MITDAVLLGRCEQALMKLKRFIPSGDADLAFEVVRLLEELDKRPRAEMDFRVLNEAAEGRSCLPPEDRE